MEQEKHEIFPHNDIQYLLVYLPDGRPNSNTHAYGHCDLAAEEYLVTDQPEPCVELIIRHSDERFARRHASVTRRHELAGEMDIKEELPNGDAVGELHVNQLLMAERVTAARQGGAIRICHVIERIIAGDNFERPFSPPDQMPAPPMSQRAWTSKLNAHLPPFRLRVNSSDKDEPERLVWPPCSLQFEFDDGEY